MLKDYLSWTKRCDTSYGNVRPLGVERTADIRGRVVDEKLFGAGGSSRVEAVRCDQNGTIVESIYAAHPGGKSGLVRMGSGHWSRKQGQAKEQHPEPLGEFSCVRDF